MTPTQSAPATLAERLAPNATVFVSSAAIMVIQLVAGRLIAQHVGQSLYTWTSIIGVTLAGIAIGNYAGGRLADRHSGRRTLGVLFLLCAIAEACVLALNAAAGDLHLLFGLPWPARIFLHVTIAFLPAFACLGAISPVISRRALALGARTGRTLGGIYAWSIAGSILGTFVTGYFLLAWFSNTVMVWASSGILAAVGAYYMATGGRAERMASAPRADAANSPIPWRTWAGPIATVFLASACVMAVELVAGRILARNFGQSIYTWTTIIGVILAGLSAGGYAGGALADRMNNRNLTAALLSLSAFCCLLIPALNLLLRNNPVFWDLPALPQILATSLVLFLPVSLFLGMVPPVVARMALGLGGAPGRTVGIVYAWGSLGSILGTFATGYFLIGWIGTVAVLCLVAGVTTALALAHAPRSALQVAWAALCAVLLICAFAPGPEALRAAGRNLALRPAHPQNVVYVDESNYCYIRISETDPANPNLRSFAIDKLVHSIADLSKPTDLKYPYEWYYQTVLDRLEPDGAPIRGLVIGGGGYAFPHFLELTRPGSHVEVVEIDPAVTEAAHAAFGLPRDTTLDIYNMDGRNRVADLVRKKRAGDDVPQFKYIFGDSINDLSVPFHLTTLEFTRMVGELLTEDGVYMLNMIDMLDSGRFLGAVLNTCAQVFPHIYVFHTHDRPEERDTFIAVCARRPLNLGGIAEEVNAAHGGRGAMLGEGARAAVAERARGLVLTDAYAPVDTLLAPVVRVSNDTVHMQRLQRAKDFLAAGRASDAVREVEKITRATRGMPEAFEVAAAAYEESGRIDEAIAAYRQAGALQAGRAAAHHRAAFLLLKRGRAAEAVEEAQKAVEADPANVDAHVNLGAALAAVRRVPEAADALRRAAALDPRAVTPRASLAGVLFNAGDLPGALNALREALALDPSNGPLHVQRAIVCARAKDYSCAWESVHKARELGSAPDENFLAALRAESGREE